MISEHRVALGYHDSKMLYHDRNEQALIPKHKKPSPRCASFAQAFGLRRRSSSSCDNWWETIPKHSQPSPMGTSTASVDPTTPSRPAGGQDGTGWDRMGQVQSCQTRILHQSYIWFILNLHRNHNVFDLAGLSTRKSTFILVVRRREATGTKDLEKI